MMDQYTQFYFKPRTGKECKKVQCDRYKDYLVWSCGNNNLKFCMNCRYAHVSQYKSSKI